MQEETEYKCAVLVRKDLNMSKGNCAQTAHATISMCVDCSEKENSNDGEHKENQL